MLKKTEDEKCQTVFVQHVPLSLNIYFSLQQSTICFLLR